MNRVRNLEMLVRATEAGSFAAAATALRVTSSAVSHSVAELERQLGTRLINRTTRQLRLTDEGHAAYRCGRDVLDRLGELDALSQRSVRPERLRGTLRVGMSVAFDLHIIGPRLGAFCAKHPELEIEVLTQHRPSEMQLAGVDVLLRVEELEETGLVARRLGNVRLGVYAAPAYLARHGTPQVPEDLQRHRCILYKPPQLLQPLKQWHFERGADRRSVQPRAVMETDNREGLIRRVTDGFGIMRLGMFDPGLITSGQLVPLLGDWTMPLGPPIYALYRRSQQLPARIAAFLDFVAEAMVDFDPEQRTTVRASL